MRHAIVLIHGIGEQKPMGTIRPFAKAVLGKLGKAGSFYSKPDRMSQSFELRKLQAAGRKKIHLYEYYWAYHLEGTSIWDVMRWSFGLIKRRWKNVPRSTRPLWALLRILVLLLVLGIVIGIFDPLINWYETLPEYGIWWLILLAVFGLVQWVIVAFLGDAARYLSPRPKNIKLRQVVRSEGIRLIRNLQNSGDYDKITIVGHSLGSVIGYDIITHLWQEYHDQLPGLASPSVKAFIRECMAKKKSPQKVIRNRISRVGEDLHKSSTDGEKIKFQGLQQLAWKEQSVLGNPWLITDFITMGSPMTHSMMLLADSLGDFEQRKVQRELPTCPPQRDVISYAYSNFRSVDVGEGKKYSPLILHHAAPFAVTKWTNLYIKARFGLFGDFVGGPLGPYLGFGIRDLEVKTKKWLGISNYLIDAHNCYWRLKDDPGKPYGKTAIPKPPIIELRHALGLK